MGERKSAWALIVAPLDLIAAGCVLIIEAVIAAVLLRAAVSVLTWLTGEPPTMPPTTPEPAEWAEPSPVEQDSCNP